MSGLLEGKRAFVTGSARGIGFAVAERFCEEGAVVALGDVCREEVSEAARRLQDAGHEAFELHVNVADEASVEEAARICNERLGGVDVLVANAGVLYLAPVLQTSREAWERVLAVNLTGAFLTCKAFARGMVERGRGGRIVVTSSLFGRRGGRENAAYSASKFGTIGLVESLAAELAPHGILVNAVCPGQVDTEMMSGLFERRAGLRGMEAGELEEEMISRIPLGRMASPREIADAFVFLASGLSGYMTGQSLVVDGGWSVGP
ncbi:short-chain dehydrogenase/reductase SDR [Rubrobacter xylanophilus DSM 9941]|uniref:Short-chain dehydrogenase/reductase SDR n=1 Tax=Rubrobacter xylanophilus (strain DSM 9941 / JCM 11954 / NBRC 16129 / PRD-1) TaxID=266117 RepID=Q1ARM3_RUBXD|nr:SDR family NAD(P)-dependent oxidoreductase [Rubrobacter xylanophilus]ABG05955.1 short-chain dehydrogenase/reductase SDR [Rubrobacter xylanophilus DSM 9941]